MVTTHQNSYKTCTISSCNKWGIKSRGVIPQYCKSHNFWNFTDFLSGYIEETCYFLSFIVIFMKSYTIIVKTLSKHMIIVILHFGWKMWFLNKNSFVSQNHWSFTEKTVMGTENNLWKFELDLIIFLDFTDIWSLKYKRNKCRVVQNFFRSI